MRSKTLRLCVDAVCVALFFLLSKLTIPIGNLHLTLASLAIVVIASLYGALDGAIVALAGEFLVQALGQYGLTPTTPLWCLPPVLRGLTVGLVCQMLAKKNSTMNWKAVFAWFMTAVIIGAVLTTLANTAVTWLDSVIFGYYSWAYVFGQFFVRLFTGIVTAVLVGIVTMPVLNALSHVQGIGGLRWFRHNKA